MYLLGAVNVFSANNTFPVNISALGKKLLLRTSTNPSVATTVTGGATIFTAPDVSPAYLGVGYIIGPRLASLEFCRRRAGLGTARSAADLCSWAHDPGFPCGRSTAPLDAAGAGDLFLGRAPHRRGRNAGGRLLHLVQDAQATGRRHGACHHRPEEIRRCACRHQPHRPRPERQGDICGRGRGVFGDDRAVLLLHRQRGESYELESHHPARWSRRW